LKDFRDFFITLNMMGFGGHEGLSFWALSLSFSALLIVVFVVWGRRLLHNTRQFEQECLFVQQVASLAGHGWIAVWKDSGVIQHQAGLAPYLTEHQNVENLSDLVTLWHEKDQPRWLAFIQEVHNECREPKTITLMTLPRSRQLQVHGYLLQKDAGELYLFVFYDVTADLNQVHALQIQKETLQQENHLFRQQLDALPFPVWQRDEHTTLTFCNQAYVDACGAPLSTILQENRCLWMLDKSEENFPLLLQPVKKTLFIQGKRKVYMFHEFQEPQSLHYFGFALDLSEADELQAKFHRHLSAYREVLDNISAGVTIYGPDRRIKYFNQAYARMFEMDQKWLLTEPTLGEVLDDLRARRLIPEQADYASYKKKELQVVTTLLSSYQEMLYLPNERSIRKIAAPHPLGGSFYIFEDVTAALTLERQYNTQLAVQRATLDNLYEAIAVFGSDNRLRFANPAFARLWRVTDPVVLQDHPHLSDLLEMARDQFDEVPDWKSYKLRLINRVTDRIPKKRRLFRKDGTVVDFSYVPLPDGSHLISYVDMTDSYQVEKILRERNESLEKADQSKTEFISQVSEALIHPLNTVAGTAEILGAEYFGSLNPQQKRYCKQIFQSSVRLLDIVHEIQEMASMTDAHFSTTYAEINIHQLVNTLYQHHVLRAQQKNVQFTLECDSEIGTMIGNEKRLSQVLQTLLSRGFRLTKAGDEMTLKVISEGAHILFTMIFPDHEMVAQGIRETAKEEPIREREKTRIERDATIIERIESEETISEEIRHPLTTERLEASVGLVLMKKLIENLEGTIHVSFLSKGRAAMTCRFPRNRSVSSSLTSLSASSLSSAA
jgi:PAS domain-containing protein